MPIEPFVLISVGICVCLLAGAIAVGLFTLSRRRSQAAHFTPTATLHQSSAQSLPGLGDVQEPPPPASRAPAAASQSPVTTTPPIRAQLPADAPTTQLGPRVTPVLSTPVPLGWGRLAVVGGPSLTQVYGLVEPEVLIGRAEDCAVVLQGDGTVSRRHARITLHGGQAVIVDLASSHGSFINGQQITQPTLLRSGDVVRVGQTVLRFEV